jgi:excisionase family DNA binding protein
MLTVAQVAQRLNVKEGTVRSWIWQRRLAHVKLNRAVRIPEEALQKLISENTIPATGDSRGSKAVA